MEETILTDLLARNARHAESLPTGYFDDVMTGQAPAAVSVCCADSRIAQEGMWAVAEPGYLFTPSTIGNQAWDVSDGERVVDGSVLYPLTEAGTRTVVVVGHTGCGAVTAALEAVRAGTTEAPAGIRKLIELLVPVVEAGLADDRIDPEAGPSLVDQLVEFNVDRQVAFLRDSPEIPAGVSVYGFVYDFQAVYGDVPGRAYLVNVDGETAVEELRALVPVEFESHVHRLL